MSLLYVELLVESIGIAREVMSFFTADEQHTVAIVQERVLDKQLLRDIIEETNEHFSKMLNTSSKEIIQEMRQNRVRDAVQDVQARVNALKTLLNTHTLDPNLITHLVISALNPLQVSLEVAKLRLQDYGDQETWQLCYISGTSALISGYAFLNQDVPHLREELEKSMKEVQRRVLNDAAAKIIMAKGEIPWECVPRLLSPEGIEDLHQLYRSLPENQTDSSVTETVADTAYDDVESV
jgi:hypothetical protein